VLPSSIFVGGTIQNFICNYDVLNVRKKMEKEKRLKTLNKILTFSLPLHVTAVALLLRTVLFHHLVRYRCRCRKSHC